MAALSSLALSFVEANDNKSLVITDITGIDGSTDWETSDINIADVDGVTYTLEMDISITTSDGTVVTYDTIDLEDEFGDFTTADDLVFTIDCSLLKVDGTAIGSSTDELPDGIWEVKYSLITLPSTEYTSTTYNTLIYGVVKSGVYEKLRAIPTNYNCNKNMDDFETREAMFAYAYLIGMEASSFTAREEELLNQLSVLERLITNASNNTW